MNYYIYSNNSTVNTHNFDTMHNFEINKRLNTALILNTSIISNNIGAINNNLIFNLENYRILYSIAF